MKKIILNLLSNLLFIIPFLFFISCESGITNKKTQICFNVNIPYFEEDSLGTSSRSVIEEGQNTFTLQVYLISKNGIERNFNRSGINPGESVFVEFNEIPLGEEVKISAELFSKDLLLSYEGETDWIQIISHKNEIQLKLKKNEITITDAETPQITSQPTSVVEIATEGSGTSKEPRLTIVAQVTDGGSISFQWQIKNDDTWTNISEEVFEDEISAPGIIMASSAFSVTLNINESRTYRCIVTNTNESVNGEKTSSITSNAATVAYVEGTLTSISASYEENGYQLFSEEFDYSKVKVKETYKGSDNSTETITVTAASNRYIISKTDDSISAIGYVPYTVTYNNTSTNLTSQLRVPVKYKLPQGGLKITGTEYTNEWGIEEKPELVAQFTGNATLSVGYAGDGGSFVPSLIYETEDSERADDYDVMTSGVDIAWDNGTATKEPSSVTVDNGTSGTKIYTATLTPKTEQTWCIGESVSASYYVKVCPWEIKLDATSDETVDVSNLTGGTSYTLSASNQAVADGTETITWVSDTENFKISDSTLITPSASTESDQTATISAKVGDQDIASVTVTVKKEIPLGSKDNPIKSWDELVDYVDPEVPISEESTIYISGNLEATEPAYINRPVTIIPVGEVNITRTSLNLYDIFSVNKNLTLQGSESSLITLSGLPEIENSSPLISCITDGVTVNLQYCTLQNANCGNRVNGSALYAGNGSIINMSNCTVQDNKGVALSLQNTGKNIIENTTFTKNQAANPNINASAIYVNNESANLELKNCSFSNNINTESSTIGELGIEEAASVTINNTTFASVTNGYNIYAYFAPSLTLKGSLSIPTLYFENSYGGSSLGIVCGEDLALKDDAPQITINPAIYTEYNGSNNPVDIVLFTLNEGQTVPDGIFTLGNEGYVINSSTGVIEAVSSETAYSDSKGITINSSTIDNTALVTVIAEETTVTNTESSGAFTSGNVTLEPYAIGKYEVTQALYKAVMGSESNPSSSKIGDNFPVEKVSWYDAVKFCNELTKKTMVEDDCVYTISNEEKDEDGIVTSATVTVDSTKKGYRLPTEAEWEFAARGGNPSDTKNWNYTYAGSNTVDDVAWYFNSYDDEGFTIEVYDESLKANSLELKNMSGNVAEWTNTEIDDEGTTKIIVRGGHYVSEVTECTVYYRGNNVTKNYTDKKIGFRLCRTITE